MHARSIFSLTLSSHSNFQTVNTTTVSVLFWLLKQLVRNSNYNHILLGSYTYFLMSKYSNFTLNTTMFSVLTLLYTQASNLILITFVFC